MSSDHQPIHIVGGSQTTQSLHVCNRAKCLDPIHRQSANCGPGSNTLSAWSDTLQDQTSLNGDCAGTIEGPLANARDNLRGKPLGNSGDTNPQKVIFTSNLCQRSPSRSAQATAIRIALIRRWIVHCPEDRATGSHVRIIDLPKGATRLTSAKPDRSICPAGKKQANCTAPPQASKATTNIQTFSRGLMVRGGNQACSHGIRICRVQ
mmetsp:Transcript_22729/g.53033  ORF Transcript_22729/g.53033 Transcript_22729/m.53033 type:complete len:207 (-) Transcript_22729:1373-1993(-)